MTAGPLTETREGLLKARDPRWWRPTTPRLTTWSVWILWLVGRLAALALMPLHRQARIFTDVTLYHQWSLDAWQQGLLPGRDYAWEYPPGAFPLVLQPLELRSQAAYTMAFALCMLVFDALVLALLVPRARATQHAAGLWLWLVAVPLLGPLVYLRLDLVPTALVVLAVAVAARKPASAGLLLAAATLVKLWPLVAFGCLLAVSARRRALAGWFMGGVAAALGLAAAAGIASSLTTSLTTQWQRGVQVESLAALPWLWARALGAEVSLPFRHLATEVDATGVTTLAGVLTAVTGLTLMVLVVRHWRRRGTQSVPALVAACAGLTVLGDKVLSPQYMLWVLGLTALMLCEPGTHQRPLPLLGGSAALLTQLVFPLTYQDLLHGAVLPLVLLTARDALLVAMACLLVRRALRTAREDHA